MSCNLRELYSLELPIGYVPSKSIKELNTEEWETKIREAMLFGEIRFELGQRILTSLERLPQLEEGQSVGVSFSGGKDSQAIFMLARMKYSKNRIFANFCDTEDEWPETYKAISDFGKWIGIGINTLSSIGIHTLLREKIPVWPKAGVRHCTKELKMVPQRDWLDFNGFSQNRKDGRPPQYRNVEVGVGVGELAYKIKETAPLLLSGERRNESKNRERLPFDERDAVIMRWTHRPVLDWTIEDIWEFIFWMKAPINKVYLLGVKRAACAGCVFANTGELKLLGEHYPHLLYEWVETEKAIGCDRRGKAIRDIYNDLGEQNRLGIKRKYQEVI